MDLPEQYDLNQFDVCFYLDSSGDYVMFSKPRESDIDDDREYELVRALWHDKYDCEIPPDAEVYAAQGLKAEAIRKGNDLLSEQQWDWCTELSADGSGLSVEDVWNLVLGLKWEIGKPILENHPGWRWLEERYRHDDPEGSILLIKRALRMAPLNNESKTVALSPI